eukprot:TRINITY_DN1466_c0_g1_i10.p1 TRINITY_DN1466_c0_g1~~TRINITY_DN1466_c0_g1_i10.p1  ORF type:complete len:137 (+),score=13.39 TRINITY_DN1466_c0_g1_i10:25-411(+)
MIRRPPRSTHCISSAASDVYKRQVHNHPFILPLYSYRISMMVGKDVHEAVEDLAVDSSVLFDDGKEGKVGGDFVLERGKLLQTTLRMGNKETLTLESGYSILLRICRKASSRSSVLCILKAFSRIAFS